MKTFLSVVCLFFFSMVIAQDSKNQDWPNINKYQSQNQQIIEGGDYPEVVFMGNSITEGWVNSNPDFFTSHNFLGRGISGQTTPQMLVRFVPDVVDLQPGAVAILAGTNDIAGNTGKATEKMITDNIKAMAQLAKANGIKVVLCSVLPVDDYPWAPGLQPIEKIASINIWLKNYAKNEGHTYVDYYTAMVTEEKAMDETYSEDGVHTNKEGYLVMEPLILKGLAKAFSK